MKATNGQIIAEANRRRSEKGMDGLMLADFIIEVMREGWAPPEVDPDVLAFREWGERRFGVNTASAYRLGDCDDTAIAEAYRAGAAASAKRIKELEAALEKVSDLLSDAVQADCENGVRSLNEAAARNYLNGFRHTREALMDIQAVCRSMFKEPDQ